MRYRITLRENEADTSLQTESLVLSSGKELTVREDREFMTTRAAAHILVVDDEAAHCYLLRHALQRAGHIVHTASNGQDALDLFARIPFDMTLVDVRMPGMDGFTLCAELRKRSNVLIVLITAFNQTSEIVHGYSLGADDYIIKPFHLREVTTRIQVLLRRKSALNSPTHLASAMTASAATE
jgi:DNA-binding response OmpR family regulator